MAEQGQILSCSQEGCPVLQDGRCLEGLIPAECPHSQTSATAADAIASVAERTPSRQSATLETDDESLDSSFQDGDSSSEDLDQQALGPAEIELGGEESLTLDLADRIAARFGAKVVLVGGVFESGKTTLVTSLYGQFLSGPVNGYAFKGSNSLCAFDRRYHNLRHNSGKKSAKVGRTQEEEMRLLDLRVVDENRVVESLMFTDVKGEFFENVMDGAPVTEEVTLAPRADVAVLLIDGTELLKPGGRHKALHHQTQLVGGLMEDGGVRPGTALAVVVSKADVLDSEAEEFVQSKEEEITRFAEEAGFGEVSVWHLAAMPEEGEPDAEGLGTFLKWIIEAGPAEREEPQQPFARPMRSFQKWGEW